MAFLMGRGLLSKALLDDNCVMATKVKHVVVCVCAPEVCIENHHDHSDWAQSGNDEDERQLSPKSPL
eukprot:6083497-Amphidinium_carterae.1